MTTIAGGGSAGYVNGLGSVARFSNTYDVDIQIDGSLIVTDYSNHLIRSISSSGEQTAIIITASFGLFAVQVSCQLSLEEMEPTHQVD